MFLDGKDVIKCSIVCKQFYVVCVNDFIWRDIFKREFSGLPCANNFYKNYELYNELQIFLKLKQNISNKSILINHRDIQIIPQKISLMVSITVINIGLNAITKIPLELCQLNNLTALMLHNNQISLIPDEIGQLNKLQYLNFGNNKIKVIPKQISLLNDLLSLDLRNNKLEYLPREIKLLTDLKILILYDNPFKNLNNYLKKKMNGMDPYYFFSCNELFI
jgi:Leucine-rich repeat (LRR) protein